MLKGINKHIIEITDLESPHFYKAILFVRPESDDYELSEIEVDAKKLLENSGYIRDIAPSGYLRRRESRRKRLILSLGIITLLLAACLVIFFIL